MKIFATQKLFAYIAFSRLKATPPKEYPDTAEMMTTVDEILPVLEKVSGEFVDFRKRADEINDDVALSKLTQEAGMEKIQALQKEVRQFELEHGKEVVTAEFENAPFTVFFKQFERWGKQWFEKLDDFIVFQKDVDKANKAES